jgi:hypothetical protein
MDHYACPAFETQLDGLEHSTAIRRTVSRCPIHMKASEAAGAVIPDHRPSRIDT